MSNEPRSTANYVPDHVGFGAYMMSDDVQDLATSVTRQALVVAVALSPESDPEDKGSGDGTRYRDHFDVEPCVVILNDLGFENPRRASRLVNDSAYSAAVEFGMGTGTGVSRPQSGTHGAPARPLGRTGAVMGAIFGDYFGGPRRRGRK